MKFITFVTGCVLACQIAPLAAADTWSPVAQLSCDRNEALIRFGLKEDTDNDTGETRLHVLPAETEARWSRIASSEHTCRLANGDEVTLRYGWGFASPYGAGNLSPEGFVSLWVNRRKVLSREQFYPRGHQSRSPDDPFLNSLTYSPAKLQRCRYLRDPDLETAPGSNLACEIIPLDLAAIPIDVLEPAASAPYGTFSVASTYNPDFCRSFVRKKSEGEYGNPSGLDVWRSAELIDISRPGLEELSPAMDMWPGYDTTLPTGVARDINENRVDVLKFDFWNDGVADTIVRLSSWNFTNHRLLFFVKNDGATDADITQLTQAKDLGRYQPFYAEHARGLGWHMLPSDEFRSMERVIFRLSETVFVLEWQGDDARPTAVLRRPGKNNALESVCTFQRLVENF